MQHKISRRLFNLGLLATGAGTMQLSSARAEAPGVVDLVAGEHKTSLVGADGPLSHLWGYNGGTPGPELRFTRGDDVEVRFRNELPEPTSIHWHGIRIDNAMDGVSGLTQNPVQPGETFTYRFTVPDAGTYWYHAHHQSWKQVAMGLYGPLIVDEPSELMDNPATDLTLMLDDWRVDRTGRFDAESLGQMMDWSHAGRLGNVLTVNGEQRPTFEVPVQTWVRLRLVNACNARVLAIDPARFGGEIIAYDGQTIGHRKRLDYAPMLLGPAQRIDFLVRFDTAGDVLLEELTDEAFAFARIAVKPGATSARPAPMIAQNQLPLPDTADARQVNLRMEGGAMGAMTSLVYEGKVQSQQDLMRNQQVWGFNGVANMTDAPLFSASRGESIVINIENQTRFEHAMHLHGHHFQILARPGLNPEAGAWRDTVMVFPGEAVKIALVADNPGKWLLHCHMLEHAAAGMTTWFDVA